MAGAAAAYVESLARVADSDPGCLGLAITGSRSAGLHDDRSDHDCALFLEEGEETRLSERIGPPPEGVDLRLFTRPSFAVHATWRSPTAWDRYAWWIADFVVDRTGGDLVREAREKGRVPPEEMVAWIDASLDWYLNQVARALRCLERGNDLGARLESAEAVRPFLQAAFALDSRRLVPYYGYLEWELERRPLETPRLPTRELLDLLGRLAAEGSASLHVRLLGLSEAAFRNRGYGRRFDEWETSTWPARYLDR